MFLVAGVSPVQRKLDFVQTVICPRCGKYGRYEVTMESMSLSLFFIPVFKWNKKFYVASSCCGSVFTVNKELGERIARGEEATITEQDLQLIQKGQAHHFKQCCNCGFTTYEDFQYCPKCSAMLKE